MTDYYLIYEANDGLSPPPGNPILTYLQEEIYLKQLTPSGIVGRTLDYRVEDPNATSDITPIEVNWDTDMISLYFNATPTNHKQQAYAMVLTPSKAQYQGTSYNILFQFTDFNNFAASKEAFLALEPTEKSSILHQIFSQCPVKLYSNDPSFYYSSAWEKLDAVDGAAFKFPGPKGDDVWFNRHKASGGMQTANIPITKHIAQIIDTFSSYLPGLIKLIK